MSDLLFLFECATQPVRRLQDAARTMGITVQAISHLYRGLARRNLAEFRQGCYRPTVDGVGWLHSHLEALESDMSERLGKLNIVRSTRALAGARLVPTERVRLTLKEGLLTALPGAGDGSQGRVVRGGRAGDIVEVQELSGIVPILPGSVTIYTLPRREPVARMEGAARRAISETEHGWVGALGLEAVVLLRRVSPTPVQRFGLAEAAQESSRLGVPCLLFVSEAELPRCSLPSATRRRSR
ncbi:transcriptional regulator [mine drainage metagenome]|uniref:Transcriptional regulator n=1 Tax=mine drainage metagenome TaxID=410659 RepID=T1BP82_9ZZZZ